MGIIAILTDFGPRGMHYVAEMKAVAMEISPHVTFIDVSHSITPYAIIEAAYILQTTVNHFPHDSIFVCVVDPGVGSERDIVAVELNSGQIIIGPDNGIFSSFVIKDQIKLIVRIMDPEFFYHSEKNRIPLTDSMEFNKNNLNNNHSLDSVINKNTLSFPSTISTTFHGRDIMMPVAAHLVNGLDIIALGDTKEKLQILEQFEAKLSDDGQSLLGCVLYIDTFGNIITNFPIFEFNRFNKLFLSEFQLIIKNEKKIIKKVPFFAGNSSEQLLLIEGSSGYMEICQNLCNAAVFLQIHVGDIIRIDFLQKEEK